MPKSISLIRRLSGGTHPRAVSLAVFLGLLAGFVHGWNLSLIALCLLVVLFDVRSRVALVCWGIGLGLSWLLAPATFLLGRVILDLTPVGAWLGNIETVAALFGWDRYTLVGGMCVGLALAWPASSLLTRGVRRTRRMLHQARQVRSRLQGESAPAVIAFPRARMAWRARIADWLRGARNGASSYEGERLLRPSGIPAAAVLLVITCATVHWHVPKMVSGRLYLAMQQANQARLEAGEFRLALWNGTLEISDLRLADPYSPSHDRIRVGQLRADLDPAALLRGRLAVRRLDASGIRTGVERSTPAELFCTSTCLDVAALTESDGQVSGGILNEEHPTEPSAEEQCLTHWPELKRNVARLGELLACLQGIERLEAPSVVPLSLGVIAQVDLRTLRATRSPLGRQVARVSIASLRADHFDSGWKLGSRAKLQVERLTSSQALSSGSAQFEIDSPDHTVRVWGKYSPHQGAPRWQISLQAREIPVTQLVAQSNPQMPLAIDGGRVSISGRGWANAKSLAIPLTIDAHGLACHAQQPGVVAGIDSQHWAAGLNHLRHFPFTARCEGTWTAPHLTVQLQQIADRFREELAGVGQHDLLAAINAPLPPDALQGERETVQPFPAAPAPAHSAPHDSMAEAAMAEDTLPEAVAAESFEAPQESAIAATPPAPNAPAEPAPHAVTSATPGVAMNEPPAAVAQNTGSQDFAPSPVASANAPQGAAPSDPQTPKVPPTAPQIADTQVQATGPIQGPGPLDLTVGYDRPTSIYYPNESAAPTTATADFAAAEIERAAENYNPLPSDAELDEWVEQQEKIEARRERQLAKSAKSRQRALEAEAQRAVKDEALEGTTDNSPSLLARVRSLWPFGKNNTEVLEGEEIDPVNSQPEVARTARGPVTAPSAGGSTWR